MSHEDLPPVVEIRIQIPRRLYEKLEDVSRRLGITVEDIVARAILKVVEEFAS